jgi:hypothetical protein
MFSILAVAVTLLFCISSSLSLEQSVSFDGPGALNFGAINPLKTAQIFRNLDYNQIFEHEMQDGNIVTSSGSVAIDTGRFTGRSPKDKYIVKQKPSEDNVCSFQLFILV